MMAKLAFLLEPFAIRNSMGSHAWVGERVCRMLLDEPGDGRAHGDFRLICNQPTMTHLAGAFPAARPYLVQIDSESHDLFAEMLADWHTHGLGSWKAIQAGSEAHVKLYEAALSGAREAYPFEVLAYWGTNETLRAAAGRLGIEVMWAELAPLRAPFPKHLCLDAEGVNGSASSRTVSEVNQADDIHDIGGMALEIQMDNGLSAYEAVMSLPTCQATLEIEALLVFIRGSRRVILLATQLADDANVLVHSGGATCLGMVKEAVATLAEPGTVFILRPHPAAEGTYHNWADDAKIRGFAEGRADMFVFDAQGGEAYLACLSIATEVVCLNSSVAFEASILAKPVRVLGGASYTPHGHRPAMQEPPVRLPDSAIKTLLDQHYIPEARFWTLTHWRSKAAARSITPSSPRLLPRLPAVAAKVLGRCDVDEAGLIHVQGLGILNWSEHALSGALDEVLEVGNAYKISGWGVDPRTGGALAGFILKSGGSSVWTTASKRRPDVAGHFQDPKKVGTGFEMIVAKAHLASFPREGLSLIGVTVCGRCQPVGEEKHTVKEQGSAMQASG